jgi:hypothetical protein
MKHIIRTILIVCSLLVAGPAVDGVLNSGLLIADAQAIVGRPMTPVSVAGVARRTTRRVIRRTAVYVAVLPVGYKTVVIEGATVYQYGTTYYQADGSQFVVVNID